MQRHNGRRTDREAGRQRQIGLETKRKQKQKAGNKGGKKFRPSLGQISLSVSPSLSLSHIHALSLSLSLYLTRSLSFFRPAVLARTVASPHFLGILLTAARVEEVVVV